MRSVVLITETLGRNYGNMVAHALGFCPAGGDVYTVPLSATGAEPATHYGCHTWATDQTVQVFQAGKAGIDPPGFDRNALPFPEFEREAFFNSLVIAAQEQDAAGNPVKKPAQHFADIADQLGLQRIIASE